MSFKNCIGVSLECFRLIAQLGLIMFSMGGRNYSGVDRFLCEMKSSSLVF